MADPLLNTLRDKFTYQEITDLMYLDCEIFVSLLKVIRKYHQEMNDVYSELVRDYANDAPDYLCTSITDLISGQLDRDPLFLITDLDYKMPLKRLVANIINQNQDEFINDFDRPYILAFAFQFRIIIVREIKNEIKVQEIGINEQITVHLYLRKNTWYIAYLSDEEYGNIDYEYFVRSRKGCCSRCSLL